jgi:hypothetical protein
MRLSTLGGYVEAIGGWLRLVVTLSDSNRQIVLVVGDSGPNPAPNGADPAD